jgi:prepilin-type N-terminal cleavage/methylation domain-containing protein
MRYNKSHNSGFTLIEVIAVLIILAIVSAVAFSRVGSNESNLRAELNNLKAALRYAQQMAIASDDTRTFTITVISDRYTISSSPASTLSLPGEGLSYRKFDGVTASGATFTFNEWGRLATGSDTSTTLQQSGGGSSKTINLYTETGYAYES